MPHRNRNRQQRVPVLVLNIRNRQPVPEPNNRNQQPVRLQVLAFRSRNHDCRILRTSPSHHNLVLMQVQQPHRSRRKFQLVPRRNRKAIGQQPVLRIRKVPLALPVLIRNRMKTRPGHSSCWHRKSACRRRSIRSQRFCQQFYPSARHRIHSWVLGGLRKTSNPLDQAFCQEARNRSCCRSSG